MQRSHSDTHPVRSIRLLSRLVLNALPFITVVGFYWHTIPVDLNGVVRRLITNVLTRGFDETTNRSLVYSLADVARVGNVAVLSTAILAKTAKLSHVPSDIGFLVP